MSIQALLSRDEALALMLPLVPEGGWTMVTLRKALTSAGADPVDADILFPGGPFELVEAFVARANEAMEAGAPGLNLSSLRLTQRVRALIAFRLRLMHPHKEAVRRSVGIILRHPARAARSTASTVDAIWHLAGDTSADFSWYTKRATLAGIYTATLFFWLRDHSDDDAPTLDFLDRRLAATAQIGKFRRRVETVFSSRSPAA